MSGCARLGLGRPLLLRLIAANCVLATALTLAQGATAQTGGPTTKSLRVVTVNTGFRPFVPVFKDAPNLADCGDDWDGSPDLECRVKKIAAGLRAGNYDVVILNEVFDEDARGYFVDELSTTFPFWVERLEDSGSSGLFTGGHHLVAPDNDSGLMLFSKHAFVNPTNDLIPCGVSDYEALAHVGVTKDRPELVGFRGFGNMSLYYDRWASKGVGYVRVTGSTGITANIFFTHTQASYSDKVNRLGDGACATWDECQTNWLNDMFIRNEQLKLINDYAACVTTSAQHDNETFILAGDLNVVGDLSNPWLDPEVFELHENNRNNRFEWDRHFNQTGPLTDLVTLGATTAATRPLDGWAYAMTQPVCVPTFGLIPAVECRAIGTNPAPFENGAAFEGPALFDRGFTTGAEQRLDYIAVGSKSEPWGGGGPTSLAPANEMCVQHMTLAYNLQTKSPGDPQGDFEGGITGSVGHPVPTSDHIGVNAELEHRAPHCDPAHALVDPPDGATGAQLRLWSSSSVQWIKINKKGTYTFHVNPKNRLSPWTGADNQLVYKVYLPTDLSRPIGSSYGESQVVTKTFNNSYPSTNFQYREMKYHVDQAPFYVKVLSATPITPPLDYVFYYQRNTCTSAAEACEIHPFESDETLMADRFVFPASAPAEAYYSFHVQRSDGDPSLNRQTIRLFATQEGTSPRYIDRIEVVDPTSQAVVQTQSASKTPTIGGQQRRTWVIGPSMSLGLSQGDNKKWLLRVRRNALNPLVDFSYWVGWETNLRYLRGGQLFCKHAQEGGWLQGHDEIWMQVWVDGWGLPTGVDDLAGIQDGFRIGDYFKKDGSGDWGGPFLANSGPNFSGQPIRVAGAARFVNRLDIQLGEDDDDYDEMFKINNIVTGTPGKKPFQSKLVFTPASGEYEAEITVSSCFSDKVCLANSDCESPGTCINRRCN
jgi:hypothetical protein